MIFYLEIGDQYGLASLLVFFPINYIIESH